MTHTFEITYTVRYEVSDEDMERFYGTSDPDEAVSIDVSGFSEDPGLLMGLGRESVTGRVVEAA